MTLFWIRSKQSECDEQISVIIIWLVINSFYSLGVYRISLFHKLIAFVKSIWNIEDKFVVSSIFDKVL